MRACSRLTAEFVAFCDCDGSLDPAQLPERLGRPCRHQHSRPGAGQPPAAARLPALHARIANIVLAWRLRRLTGERVTDLGPMRAARRVELLSLGLEDRRSGYPLESMSSKASLRQWRILTMSVPDAPAPASPR